MLLVQIATSGRGWGPVTPALGGLLATITAWVISLAVAAGLNARQQRLEAGG
jgi:hypothetical protein